MGQESLLQIGNIHANATQHVDVRVEDINTPALLSLADSNAHKHTELIANFGVTTALSWAIGIRTPGISFSHEARVSVATLFGTDTSGTLGELANLRY